MTEREGAQRLWYGCNRQRKYEFVNVLRQVELAAMAKQAQLTWLCSRQC